MHRVYYNSDGWICNLYPYNLPIDNINNYIDINDEEYNKLLSSQKYHAWKYDGNELINTQYEDEPLSEILDRIRTIRDTDCFSIINRGKLWYDTLSKEQITELNKWYNEWLDLPNKYVGGDILYPEKPEWLE